MNFIEKKFEIVYSVSKAICKSSPTAEINNQKFSPSVKISCSNTYERKNEKTNCIDVVESSIVFKILCSSDLNAGILTTELNKFFRNGNKLSFTADIPRFYNNEYSVTLIENDEFYLDYLKSFDSKKK